MSAQARDIVETRKTLPEGESLDIDMSWLAGYTEIEDGEEAA